MKVFQKTAVGGNGGFGRIRIDVQHIIKKGEIVGLLGPNGAGKTTTFRMITEQEQPDSGSIKIGESVQLGPLNVWTVYEGKLAARQVHTIMSHFSGTATIVELAPGLQVSP